MLILPPLEESISHRLILSSTCRARRGRGAAGCCARTLGLLRSPAPTRLPQPLRPWGFCALQHPPGYPSPSSSGPCPISSSHQDSRRSLSLSSGCCTAVSQQSLPRRFQQDALRCRNADKMTSANSRTDFITQLWKIISVRLSILVKMDEFIFTDVALGLFYG